MQLTASPMILPSFRFRNCKVTNIQRDSQRTAGVVLRDRHAHASGSQPEKHTVPASCLGQQPPVAARSSLLSRLSPAFLMLLLAGCVMHGEIIEQRIDDMELQIAALDEQLDRLENLQKQNHMALVKAQDDGISRLLEATTAEVNRLANERVPMPILVHTPVPSESTVQRPQAKSPASRDNATIRGKQLIGSVEDIHIMPPGIILPARVDTGAESSSLDARDLQEFKRDGNSWVRFRTVDAKGKLTDEIEQPIIRHARIRQSGSSEAERRPVVRLQVTIGPHTEVAEFTLSSRGHLSYPVLIGRNVLTDVMVVDVGQSRIAPPVESGTVEGGQGAR